MERKTEEKIESNQPKSNTNDSLLKLWIRIKLRSGFKQNKATIYTTIHITVRSVGIRTFLNDNIEPLRLDNNG